MSEDPGFRFASSGLQEENDLMGYKARMGWKAEWVSSLGSEF
jgi:predicted dithiol-disulfide oxidoreductase (DUF899 family)